MGSSGLLDTAYGHRFAPGGRYRIVMQPPEGDVMYVTGAFREVVYNLGMGAA